MLLFLVSQVAKTREITREQAKRAMYLQRQLAKPVEKFEANEYCDMLKESLSMTQSAFCFRCRLDLECKIATKQCKDKRCKQWFCSGHMKGKYCHACQELRSLKHKSRGKS